MTARLRTARVALAVAAALAAASAPACSHGVQEGPVVSPVPHEARLISIAPAVDSRPLPSTGADRAAPSPADADDSKMKHVWTSHDEPHAENAPADGSIARWNDDEWYIVHDFAEAGRQFLELEPGDLVRIDGKTVRIRGIVDEPRDSYSNEVRAQVGDDVTIFQTCLGSSALRVAYGDELEKGAGAGEGGPAV